MTFIQWNYLTQFSKNDFSDYIVIYERLPVGIICYQSSNLNAELFCHVSFISSSTHFLQVSRFGIAPDDTDICFMPHFGFQRKGIRFL